MSKDTDLSEQEKSSARDTTTWDKLYCFLAVRVRHWVYSTGLTLWNGNEEDIAADILQDAMVGTVTYALQHSLWVWENEIIPSRPLKYISSVIAYRYYQKQVHHDSRISSIRLRSFTSQGYVTISEITDLQEMAIASAFQEWSRECLVKTIMKIPRKPRHALLIYLANHAHFDRQPVHLLQKAFRKRDIQLQNYQQPLSDDIWEQNRHNALLQLACGQIIREQKEENDDLLSENRAMTLLPSLESTDITYDAEIAALAACLKATVPSPLPDLAFREKLREDLMDIVIDHQISEVAAAHSAQIIDPSDQERPVVDPVDENTREEFPLTENSDPGENEPASVLTVLATYLDTRAPLISIDPVFREALYEKLKDIPAKIHAHTVTEKALDETEKLFQQLPEEWYPTVQTEPDADFHEDILPEKEEAYGNARAF